jgi:FtsP/CotA-like multicopper oxidase with cupredoxin domain
VTTRRRVLGWLGAAGGLVPARRGERVAVEVGNRLPEPTSLHWHGMHLPAAMDGGPSSRWSG